jgi:Ser/Thr protein kinase RdoA (MazF antagonist)
VLRPASPHAAHIHAFLRFVRAAGFGGVPEPIGVDDGRERLTFLEGEVPLTPYPVWSQSDDALASVARLLRGLHDAAQGFDIADRTWNHALADPEGGTLVCHNDIEPSNVVFRNGVAVAFIDFEFAAPGRAVYDVARLARLCAPIDDDFDQARLGWQPADRPARVRLVADSYGLTAHERAEMLAAIDLAVARIGVGAQRDVSARRRQWWSEHRDEFVACLR